MGRSGMSCLCKMPEHTVNCTVNIVEPISTADPAAHKMTATRGVSAEIDFTLAIHHTADHGPSISSSCPRANPAGDSARISTVTDPNCSRAAPAAHRLASPAGDSSKLQTRTNFIHNLTREAQRNVNLLDPHKQIENMPLQQLLKAQRDGGTRRDFHKAQQVQKGMISKNPLTASSRRGRGNEKGKVLLRKQNHPSPGPEQGPTQDLNTPDSN